ncbi:MAG: DUF6477 family protein [Pseudomonadota bacterium]
MAFTETSRADILANLRRPRLLISAARFGLVDYNRARDLKRLINSGHPPNPGVAVDKLIDQEANLEETRKTGSATYSIARHVEVLIALMAEAQLLRRA